MFQTQTNTVLSLLTQNVDKWTSVKSLILSIVYAVTSLDKQNRDCKERQLYMGDWALFLSVRKVNEHKEKKTCKKHIIKKGLINILSYKWPNVRLAYGQVCNPL